MHVRKVAGMAGREEEEARRMLAAEETVVWH